MTLISINLHYRNGWNYMDPFTYLTDNLDIAEFAGNECVGEGFAETGKMFLVSEGFAPKLHLSLNKKYGFKKTFILKGLSE